MIAKCRSALLTIMLFVATTDIASAQVWIPIDVGGGVTTWLSPVPTYAISGNTSVAGVTVSAGGVSVVSNASGDYSLSRPAGAYTVTASKAGCSFAPTSQAVTLGPNKTGISFTTACSLGFPRGSTSYADNYIRNFPYSSTAGQRWQALSTPTTALGARPAAHPEPALNAAPYSLAYPVYSTGYRVYDQCDFAFGWSPALDTCNGGSTNCGVYRAHPRPNIGSGIPIWMDGLNGNDNAGYDLRSVGGGYHELSDKFVVIDPLGHSTRNTGCQQNYAANIREHWTPALVWAVLQRDDWGPAARKVYPGEITPDYWGIVPTDATTYRWESFVARGGTLAAGAALRRGVGYVLVTTSAPAPRPVFDGVFGGGDGPKCITGFVTCISIANAGHLSRAKLNLMPDGEWYLTISGYATNLDGIINNTSDVLNNLSTLSGAGTVHSTNYAIINQLNARGIAGSVHILGHSLGAMDAVTLYNLGYGADVTGYSVPFPTPIAALNRRGSNLSGLAASQRPVVLYSSLNDIISNEVAVGCGTTTHACRINSNINELVCNNGGSYLTFNNPHDRNKYQTCAGGWSW